MPKAQRSARTHDDAVVRSLDALSRRINTLAGRKANVAVVSGTGAAFTLGDADGSVWIDRDDHTFHYVVNGNEYKFQGTQV